MNLTCGLSEVVGRTVQVLPPGVSRRHQRRRHLVEVDGVGGQGGVEVLHRAGVTEAGDADLDAVIIPARRDLNVSRDANKYHRLCFTSSSWSGCRR